VTKALAVSRLSDDRSIHLIGPFSLMLAYNRGVAFSLGATVGAPLVIVAILIVGAVVMLGRRLPGRSASIAVALIAGGALGNLADRLFRPQGVVDFLHSTFWPTFNVADSAITIGCVLLGISVIWGHEASVGRPAEEGS
jgi:signal peptidase II